ncbi:unnamed protein product [Mucor hiemalis]
MLIKITAVVAFLATSQLEKVTAGLLSTVCSLRVNLERECLFPSRNATDCIAAVNSIRGQFNCGVRAGDECLGIGLGCDQNVIEAKYASLCTQFGGHLYQLGEATGLGNGACDPLDEGGDPGDVTGSPH